MVALSKRCLPKIFRPNLMKKIEVAIPWNNASYLPCNGFHPLYQALFDNPENSAVQLNVGDELAFAERLVGEEFRNVVFSEVEQIRSKLVKKWSRYKLGDKFLQYVSADDFWLTAAVPGEIEFHHTSPLVTGERSFVFHCESFLPVFMPFAYQGRGDMAEPEAVRDFYSELFGDACLGIYSHLPETLDHLAAFFRDGKFEAKLHHSRTGLSESTVRQLGVVRNERDAPPRFLFTSSAHQQPVAFKLRGGFSALGFAYKYLNENRRGEFIFRCARPADVDLRHFGIDIAWLREKEKQQKIIWVEGFLPDREQLALFRAADFFLLPSVNLHSVSIMQAQLAGAIPVVTDTLGTDHFVTDGETGIRLPEVKAAVWKKDATSGGFCDDHSLWSPELAVQLADEMYRRITALLDTRHECEAMRHGMRGHAVATYSGILFRQEFHEVLTTGWHQASGGHPRISQVDLPLHSYPGNLFVSPPVPVRELSVEHADVYHVKGFYWFFSRTLDLGSVRTWSVMQWASNNLLGTSQMTLSTSLGGLSAYLLPMDGASPVDILLKLEDRIKRLAENHSGLKRTLRRIYPFVKPIIIVIEKALIEEDETVSLFKRRLKSWLRSVYSTMPRTYQMPYSSFVGWRKRFWKYRVVQLAVYPIRWLRTLFSVAIRLLLSMFRHLWKRIKQFVDKHPRETGF